MSNKVSIIVPVYNIEQYLKDCLDSILSQTYSDYEVVAVNDGSTDTSIEILESYRDKFHDRLVIVNQKNMGLSAARNSGIEKSTGDFLYYLDGDDFISSDMLEKCVSYFNKYNVDSLFFNATSFSDGINKELSKDFNYTRQVSDGVYKNSELFSIFMNRRYIVNSCCYMLRKNKFKHLRFPVGVIHEDNYYTTKILVSDGTVSYVSKEEFFNRRVRPNSIVTQAKTHKHSDGYYAVEKMLLSENGDYKLVREFCGRLFYTGTDIELSINETLKLNRRIKLISESLRYGFNYKFCLRLLFPSLYSILKRTQLQFISSQ